MLRFSSNLISWTTEREQGGPNVNAGAHARKRLGIYCP
jgi:hypothetical protein